MLFALYLAGFLKSKTMRNSIKAILIFIFIFLISFSKVSVLKAQDQLFLRFGGLIPQAQFGNYAGAGVNVGIQYCQEYKVKGVKLCISGDFLLNPLKNSLRKEIEEDYLHQVGSVDLTFPKILNVPIFLGIMYSYQINEAINICANADLGMDLFYPTKFVVERGSNKISQIYKFSLKPAFKCGVGVQLRNKISIDISYQYLGKQTISYHTIVPGYWTIPGSEYTDVRVLSVCLGINLKN
jgi:hypothetical protein